MTVCLCFFFSSFLFHHLSLFLPFAYLLLFHSCFWINAAIPLLQVRQFLKFSTHTHTLNMKLQCMWSKRKSPSLPVLLQKKTSLYMRLDVCLLLCKPEEIHTFTKQHCCLPFPNMALNPEWNHIGPLCHNPTLSHKTVGVQGSAHMYT